MACGAVINAVWDLWSRIEGKPLWEMVVVSTASTCFDRLQCDVPL